MKRDCSGWAFMPCSGDDFGLTWLPPLKYLRILIRTWGQTQGASNHRRRGSAFSVMVGKYWNRLPASVVTAISLSIFKKGLEEVWTEAFPHLPHRLNTHLLISLFPPIPLACHPLAVITTIFYPTPCSVYVISSSPLWPTFYHYKP